MYLSKPATVEFDPSNKTHRAAARAFLKRKAWVDCPMRFTHDPSYGSIADQVQAKLLEWYVAQEEARETKRSMNAFHKKGFQGLTVAQGLKVAEERGMFPSKGPVVIQMVSRKD